MAWLAALLAATTHAQTNLWQLAKDSAAVHRFSTIFIAQDVLHRLSTPAGLNEAVAWCKNCGITHVYLETFRDGYQAERATLVRARDRFRSEGFLVSGCVATTVVGKPSSGWGPQVCCYTDLPTQASLQNIFEYTAGLFDQIMIDDYYLEDCTCPDCDKARQARRVTIGEKTYPVEDESWATYHCSLMLHLSQDRVLSASRKINPNVRMIIKFPQWYDMYQERGYDVQRETAAFDRIWVGTETRDYTNRFHWGGTVQYEGYFLMRWLGEIGKDKCGGGWFDWLGTTEPTFVEQARQTILAGARESALCCYGGLNPGKESYFTGSVPWSTPTGAADTVAFCANAAELLATAREVQKRRPVGIAAYKPISSAGGPEMRIFDFIGMLGLPLVPCHQFPTNAPVAFFPVHAFRDPNIVPEMNNFIKTGRPMLITKNLATLLAPKVNFDATNVLVLTAPEPPDRLLTLPQAQLDEVRVPLLAPLHVTFQAPNMVALYLFEPKGWVIENFNNTPVTVVLNGQSRTIAARGWHCQWQ